MSQAGQGPPPRGKIQLIDFLKANLDVFTWNHEDMVGIDPNVMVGIDPNVMLHRFNIDPNHKLVHQKRRPMTVERYVALKEKVDKLLVKNFIREARYPVWVANPIL